MKQYLIIPIVIAGWCGYLCAGGAEAVTTVGSSARIVHYPQVEWGTILARPLGSGVRRKAAA